MHEWQVPRVGFVKVSWGDYLHLLLGVGFVGLALSTVIMGPFGWGSLLLAGVQGLAGVALCGITIWHARRRVLWEEWVNPIAQLEAVQRHALFEGV